MLFEMLTGKLPFEADSPVSVAIKQIQSIPTHPREINKDIPVGIEEITLRAMQKDASQRYQCVGTLKDLKFLNTTQKSDLTINILSMKIPPV